MKAPRGFWVVWTAVAVDLLSFGIVIPLLPLYADSFGASPAAIGLILASYSVAQLLLAPFWGRLSDRLGRRPVLLVTLAGSTLGSLVLGLAGSIPMLVVGRIIDGASGASVALARTVVADIASPEHRSRLMGLLGAAFGVGFVVGPGVGAAARLLGPGVPFLVAAAISLLNLIVAIWRLPETKPHLEKSTVVPLRPPLPSRVRRLVAANLVAVTGFSIFEATFALAGQRRLGWSDSLIALIFAGLGLLIAITQGLAVGRLASRLGEARLLPIALGVNGLGLLGLGAADGPVLLLLSVAVLAVGQGLAVPSMAALVAAAAPTGGAGAALGAHQSSNGLGRVIGPVVGGALLAVALPLPFLAAASLMAGAAFVCRTRDSRVVAARGG
ncbi:MAG TPA: MFS transporter [Acidimicrobiia bacterium]|nr:MFS transporter [Acidimicrobiia bacterium]